MGGGGGVGVGGGGGVVGGGGGGEGGGVGGGGLTTGYISIREQYKFSVWKRFEMRIRFDCLLCKMHLDRMIKAWIC